MADPLAALAVGEWEAKSRAMRAKFQMSRRYAPWTGRASNPPELRGLPQTARVTEAVNIAWGARGKAERKFPWWLAASQCISRSPFGARIPCLTTSTMLYDYEQDCVRSSDDKLRLQGLPLSEVPFGCMSDSEKSDVAGEGMFAADVGAVLLAVFLCSSGPWWKHEGCEGQAAS